ncbi:MAG: aldolase [Verrucomicrobia bacterium]|nr:aldolase [Verrucomicrobiota bacterium]
MRRSKVLAKLRAGKVARVCAVTNYLPFFPAMAAHSGYDGVWVDGEHRPFDAREAQALIAFHHLADIDCMWRPPTLEKTLLYRLLEDGAAGLMIPHVSTPERAQQLVQAVKFPPLGDRGLDGSGLDGNFYINLPATYPQDANRETFLAVQIETPLALDNVEAIAAVPGVDVIFLGPGDLSLRLKCAPAVNDPQMMAAQKKIAAAARKHGKAWGRPVGTVEDAKTIVDLGAQLVVYGSAYWAISRHLQQCQTQLDKLLGKVT